jgi:hypothetical protein
MNRSILRNGLWIGIVCAGLAGCQSSGETVAKKSSKPAKPEDPTAWTGSEITKDDAASSKGLPTTSGLQGGWSSEARDIEKSLGYGR